jgi:tetratricopeptide (TPR) repeat protein
MKLTFRNAIAIVSVLAALASVGCRRADMGGCTNASGDAPVLIRACTAAIESGGLNDAELSTAYRGRARGYMIQHKNALAVVDMDTLVRLQPRNGRALAYRGYAHSNTHQWGLAISDFKQQIALDPDNDVAWSDLGYVYMYKEQHDFVKAGQSVEHALQLRPDSPRSLDQRCLLHAMANEHLDDAMADCNWALRQRPNDAGTLYSRGFVHFRQQQYAEAVKDLDASIASDSTYNVSYYLRGLSKIAMGQAGGEADIAHARALRPDVADQFAGYGIPAVR